MKGNRNIVKRILLCPPAGVGFFLLTSLARLLGGLISGARPVVNWVTDPSQLPMPVTLIALLLFILLGGWEEALVISGGCALGAALGGFANNLPVDYSNGWPMNVPGGYLNGGMTELVVGVWSVLLAAAVQLLLSLLRRRKEKKEASAGPKDGSGRGKGEAC